MSDGLSNLRKRYQEALKRLANEMRLPESTIARIVGDLGRASDGVLNLRGVFAGKRINQALDEIIAIAREHDALCGKCPPVEKQRSSHTKLLLR